MITIAYGDDSGAEALAAISAATDGATYRTSDPGRILEIFLDAVGQRACRPDCELRGRQLTGGEQPARLLARSQDDHIPRRT